jgi:hypothetical protein
MFAPRPKPKREPVALERLTFSAKLQMRDLPDGALFDPATVKVYAEALEDGAQFPPLEAVCEKLKNRQPVYWVFGGFTRGEAYRVWGKANSVEVLVYDGTFADAQFYALSENRKHGAQSTHGDKTKAVCVLLDTPTILSRAKQAVTKGVELRAAIASACGVSQSLVTHILNGRGLSVQGVKLVPKEPSIQSATKVNIDLAQTEIATTPALASPPADPEKPADGSDLEDLYSLPADYAPPAAPAPPSSPSTPAAAPAPVAEPEPTEAQQLTPTQRFDADRALADQLLRELRAAQDSLAKLLARPGGALLVRATIATVPQFERRAVAVKGQSPRMAWYSRQLASVEQAVMRCRPKAVCAGCRGAKCSACRGCGFVPSDESLVGAGAPAELDFGDPFAAEAPERGQ